MPFRFIPLRFALRITRLPLLKRLLRPFWCCSAGMELSPNNALWVRAVGAGWAGCQTPYEPERTGRQVAGANNAAPGRTTQNKPPAR